MVDSACSRISMSSVSIFHQQIPPDDNHDLRPSGGNSFLEYEFRSGEARTTSVGRKRKCTKIDQGVGSSFVAEASCSMAALDILDNASHSGLPDHIGRFSWYNGFEGNDTWVNKSRTFGHFTTRDATAAILVTPGNVHPSVKDPCPPHAV